MNKKRSHIFRGLASIFLAFTVLFGTVMSVALSWEGRVNELLGVADEMCIRDRYGDGEEADFKKQPGADCVREHQYGVCSRGL